MSRSQENKKEKNYNAWPLRDSVQDTPTFLFFFFFWFCRYIVKSTLYGIHSKTRRHGNFYTITAHPVPPILQQFASGNIFLLIKKCHGLPFYLFIVTFNAYYITKKLENLTS